MLSLVFTALLLAETPSVPAREPVRPLPSNQFELGGGLGLGEGGLGLQLAVRLRHLELFTGAGVLTLFGEFVGGLRYVAKLETGRTFTLSLYGGSLWLHPERANEFGPSQSLFTIGTLFGGRHVYPSGWYTQAGIGPSLYVEVCYAAPGCDPGTHLLPGASFELGFGYAF